MHENDLRQRDLHVELLAVTDGAAVLDHLLHLLDGGLDLGVDGALVDLGHHEEVHRGGGVEHDAAQVLVHELGEEGRERRHHATQHEQYLEERRERVGALVLAALAREALLVHAHVPG